MLSIHTKKHLGFVYDTVLGVLTNLACAKQVGVFGSFATDARDEWSDIDLFVACDEPVESGRLIMAEINANIPILCFRPFSAREVPNGRYWFKNHSPFHKLDISFHGQADWLKLIDEHKQGGNSIRCIDCSGGFSPTGAPMFLWEYTPGQKGLFDIMHRVHRYGRACARYGTDSENLSLELAAMKSFMDRNHVTAKYDKFAWTVAERMVEIVENNLNRIGVGRGEYLK